MMRKVLLSYGIYFCILMNSSSQSVPVMTWVSGTNLTDQAGVYGTLGTASTSNIPGARENSCSWVDNSNNLWLFGGNGCATTSTQGRLNDLWKYNIATNEWTWVSGSNSLNSQGIYGSLGVANNSNIPGGRINAVTWKDSNGDLWLFGGQGRASAPALGYLNDLWKYDITTNQWTWISGSNMINQTGNYGSIGVANASNVPGGKYGAVSWIDNDNLYLFGGQIAAATRTNDLWKFNITTNQWTWISGSNLSDQLGIYGTMGTASPTNIPGARQAGISWVDNSHQFYMYGGDGMDYNGNPSYLNDIWQYNIASNQWTWMNGADTTFSPASYGVQGVTSATNRPGARQMSIPCKDANGDFWFFGGWGSSSFQFGRLNDLWKYNVSSNQFTWVAGDNDTNQIGVYGSLGVGDVNNIPGARRMSISWSDNNGTFWLFGGNMTDGGSGSLLLNDLWKINISGNVGIETMVGENIKLYPNPSYDQLNIELFENQPCHIIISDMMGKVFYDQTILHKESIDISLLRSGIYFVQVNNQKRKIIKY